MPDLPTQRRPAAAGRLNSDRWLLAALLVFAVVLPLALLKFSAPRAQPRSDTSQPQFPAIVDALPAPHSDEQPEPKPIAPPFDDLESPPPQPTDAPQPPTAVTDAAPVVSAAAPAPLAYPPTRPRRFVRDDALLTESLPPPLATRPAEFDRSPEARRLRIEQFGGSVNTENAVEAGLQWLAAHQEPSGLWSRTRFPQRCPDRDECGGIAVARLDYSLDAGLSGLCVLAFLGAGYTDEIGPHRQTVAAAVDALLRLQRTDGGFGADGDRMAGYNDSLATLALLELYELTGRAELREPAERGVRRLLRNQQALGGWDYLATPDAGRNDTSITGWMVQALQSALVAGIDVPRTALLRSALHFSRAALPDGRVWYADAGVGFKLEDGLQPGYRYGPAMSAVGLSCQQMLGWNAEASPLRQQRALLLADLPDARRLQGGDASQLHDYYYWYYGTLAMFQLGDDDWQRWNAALRDALLPLQDRSQTARGVRRHSFGSWPPFAANWGKWGRAGSRIYSTAVCVLTLEIYYRHTPAYLEDRVGIGAADWSSFLQTADARERRLAIDALGGMRVEIGEPPLLELLRDREPDLARAAARALVAFDSPAGRAVLESAGESLPAFERELVSRALRRIRELADGPRGVGALRRFDGQRGLATVELPRAFAGLSVVVERDGRAIARGRVVQRFAGTDVVVCALQEINPVQPPRQGDAVRPELRELP